MELNQGFFFEMRKQEEESKWDSFEQGRKKWISTNDDATSQPLVKNRKIEKNSLNSLS